MSTHRTSKGERQGIGSTSIRLTQNADRVNILVGWPGFKKQVRCEPGCCLNFRYASIPKFGKSKRLARVRARRKASSLVIGYSPFVASTISQEIRANHSARLPSVYLEIRRASSQALTDSLIADACQACVMVRPPGQHDLEAILLRSEHLSAVWPRAYQANLSAVGLIELRAHPLILPAQIAQIPFLRNGSFPSARLQGSSRRLRRKRHLRPRHSISSRTVSALRLFRVESAATFPGISNALRSAASKRFCWSSPTVGESLTACRR